VADPILIRLVHGTFDARKPGVPHWADPDGLLAEGIKSRLPEDLKDRVCFEPLDWTGGNSFAARSAASGDLAGKLAAADQPCLLVGHSHGGTVIADALTKLPADAVKPLGVCTMATPFVARTISLEGAAGALALFAPIIAVWILLGGGMATLIHQAWISSAACFSAALLSLFGFQQSKVGRWARIVSSLAVVAVPLVFVVVALWHPGPFGTFVAMLLGVFCIFVLTHETWLNWIPIIRPEWSGIPYETEIPKAPNVPLLALRLPSDEASFAIVAAQALVWLDSKSIGSAVASLLRRLNTLLSNRPIITYAALLAALTAFAAFLKQPESPWWIVPIAGFFLLATSWIAVAIIAAVFLLWLRVLTALLLAKAVGLEVLDDIGAVGVYCEPLPRWSSHKNCRLEILGWTESDVKDLPALRHSMHRLPFVHQRLANWIVEMTQSPSPLP
jgi:hypothetical protein